MHREKIFLGGEENKQEEKKGKEKSDQIVENKIIDKVKKNVNDSDLLYQSGYLHVYI